MKQNDMILMQKNHLKAFTQKKKNKESIPWLDVEIIIRKRNDGERKENEKFRP